MAKAKQILFAIEYDEDGNLISPELTFRNADPKRLVDLNSLRGVPPYEICSIIWEDEDGHEYDPDLVRNNIVEWYMTPVTNWSDIDESDLADYITISQNTMIVRLDKNNKILSINRPQPNQIEGCVTFRDYSFEINGLQELNKALKLMKAGMSKEEYDNVYAFMVSGLKKMSDYSDPVTLDFVLKILEL